MDLAGTYKLSFQYYNSRNEDVFDAAEVYFTVNVVNLCASDDLVITAPEYETMMYTIGTEAQKYELPLFTTEPAYCADLVNVAMPPFIFGGKVGSAVTFDGVTVSIYYNGDVDLAGSSEFGTVYTVAVTG